MKIKYSYLFIYLVFLTKIGLAQDYHYSQFDANPFYINPALTGERLTEYKGIQFNANYKDQMAQYTQAPGSFKSFALGADEPINSKFSLGQYIFNDQAPTGSFNTLGILLSGAHNLIDQKEDNKSNQNLSVGVQLGILRMTVEPGGFTYSEQYSADSQTGFDTNLPSGESYDRQNFTKLNVNFGIYYRVISKNKKLCGFSGFSIYNITQPNQSYFGAYSTLPLRYNLHGGIRYMAGKQLTMMPQVLYMNQGKATELNLSMLIFTKLEGTLYEPIYGFGFRNKDAVIFQLGLKYKATTFRASYDIVTNYTKAYKNRGLEFSLVHTFAKKNQKDIKKETDTPSDQIIQN